MSDVQFVLVMTDEQIELEVLDELSPALESLADDVGLLSARAFFTYRRASTNGVVAGLRLELEGEPDAIRAAVEAAVDVLRTNTEILHIVKVADASVQDQNARHAARIYQLESRLREALSLLLLSTVEDGSFYSLLDASQVGTNKDVPSNQALEAALENEFFYVSFSEYKNVIKRKLPGSVPDVLAVMRATANYDQFLAAIHPTLITDEKTADFVTSLSTVLDSIEKARNCVAHNRQMSRKLLFNFDKAATELDAILDRFFAHLTAKDDPSADPPIEPETTDTHDEAAVDPREIAPSASAGDQHSSATECAEPAGDEPNFDAQSSPL